MSYPTLQSNPKVTTISYVDLEKSNLTHVIFEAELAIPILFSRGKRCCLGARVAPASVLSAPIHLIRPNEGIRKLKEISPSEH